MREKKKEDKFMTKKQVRNIIGAVVCFVLCCIFGGIGLAFMIFREVSQSDEDGFPVENDDLMRYAFIGSAGYIVNVVLLLTLC